MILPVQANPALAALALMIQKGGTIRLRRAELPPMAPLAISIEQSPTNPEVLHFKTVTQEDVRRMLIAQAIATPAKEEDGSATES